MFKFILGLMLGLATLSSTSQAQNLQTRQQQGAITYAKANEIAGLAYQAILGRQADIGGLNAATQLIYNEGYSGVIRWTAWLAGCPEFQANARNTRDSFGIVDTVFYTFLGRAPTAFEYQIWVNELTRTNTLSQSVWGMASGQEFYYSVILR